MAEEKSQSQSRKKKKEKDTRSPEEIIGETARIIMEKMDGPEAMAQELVRLMGEGTPRQRIQAIEVGYSLTMVAEELQRQRAEGTRENGLTGDDQGAPLDETRDQGAQKSAPSPEKRKRRKLPAKVVRF